MYQVLKALEHMHNIGIFHRDIKPENILLLDETVKLADLGSCRGMYTKQPFTEYISTRWYRSPECLLTDGYYNNKMDIWGVGCVLFEVLSLMPLFPGTDEVDQIHKIHNILGIPSKEVLENFKKYSSHIDFNFTRKEGTGIAQLIPHVSREAHDVILKMLTYNPNDRPTAKQVLNHPYFKEFEAANNKISVMNGKENSRLDEDSASDGSKPPDKRHGSNSLLGEKPIKKLVPKKDMKADMKHNSSSDEEELNVSNVYE